MRTYKAIKSYYQSGNQGFFKDTFPITHLVNKYCDSAESILGNLARQMPDIDDAKYAKDYLDQTKTAIVADLKKFKANLTNQEALARVTQLLNKLTPEPVAIQHTVDQTGHMIPAFTQSNSVPASVSSTIDNEWNKMMFALDQQHVYDAFDINQLYVNHASNVESNETMMEFTSMM
ncbi:hypothetical protein [Legionella cardiaca]|uniref:Uncharacterized protein n=1 Tax=Legionella cardiaca TaxID=1071983 RepID=A0ABY8ANE4_9GAMM|nr:hypothetical protein [Legionella cardiaca]WED42165.1 hypothetical protein PXX05_09510 [Legionella cardiaca]